MNLNEVKNTELINLYSECINELRKRRIIRTKNNQTKIGESCSKIRR